MSSWDMCERADAEHLMILAQQFMIAYILDYMFWFTFFVL